MNMAEYYGLLVLCATFLVCSCEVVTVTDDNWSEILTGQWMVEFYAPWCPHCRSFESVWEEFGQWADTEDDLSVGKVDVTTQPVLAGQFLISQLPTILHIKDGVVRECTLQDHSYSGLRKYIINEKWADTTPIPWYKSPTSLHMRLFGYLFILSKKAQVLEDYLRKEYELPTWGIFCLIAAVTVVAGLLVGGVCLIISGCISRKISGKPHSQKLPRETRRLKPAKEDPKEQQQQEQASGGVRQRVVGGKKSEND